MNTDLNIIEARFKTVLKAAPRLLGNHAVNFFLDSFKRQAWLGNRLQPWAKRRHNKRRPGRAILVDSGRLRRSIRITNITVPQVTIGTDVPFAKAHNEGFRNCNYQRYFKERKQFTTNWLSASPSFLILLAFAIYFYFYIRIEPLLINLVSSSHIGNRDGTIHPRLFGGGFAFYNSCKKPPKWKNLKDFATQITQLANSTLWQDLLGYPALSTD